MSCVFERQKRKVEAQSKCNGYMHDEVSKIATPCVILSILCAHIYIIYYMNSAVA